MLSPSSYVENNRTKVTHFHIWYCGWKPGAGALIGIKDANDERTQHDIVRVHTYVIEQHKQHDDTTRVACNITKTMMMMRRLADVDHHA